MMLSGVWVARCYPGFMVASRQVFRLPTPRLTNHQHHCWPGALPITGRPFGVVTGFRPGLTRCTRSKNKADHPCGRPALTMRRWRAFTFSSCDEIAENVGGSPKLLMGYKSHNRIALSNSYLRFPLDIEQII